jgi:hypothetical protein
MGNYPHGRAIKSQLANGVGLPVRFIIVSDLVKSNSSEVFSEVVSEVPMLALTAKIQVFFLLLPPMAG